MIDVNSILYSYYAHKKHSDKLTMAQVRYKLSRYFSLDDVSCIIGTDCSYGFKEFSIGEGDKSGYIKAETNDNRILYFKVKGLYEMRERYYYR